MLTWSRVADTYTLFAVRDADLPSQTQFIDGQLPIGLYSVIGAFFVNGSYGLDDWGEYECVCDVCVRV